MIDKMIFGKKLYELRTKSGMSQNRIARILNVSYQAVSKWENGQSLPDIELLMPLAGLFGISVEYLLSDNMSLEDDSIKRDIVDTNDKKFFEDNVYNPYVKLIYMACDARMMPIKDNVLDCVCSYGGYENVMENMIDAIKESYRILKNDQKCIYSMCLVKDLNDRSVQKWIELLKNTGWGKMDYTIAKIQNKAYWFDINRDIGFKDCKIIELSEEMPAPDADVFPYENEILRWMGEAVIVSTK